MGGGFGNETSKRFGTLLCDTSILGTYSNRNTTHNTNGSYIATAIRENTIYKDMIGGGEHRRESEVPFHPTCY